MTRGRLIFRYLADIASLNTVGTAAIVGGGYDDEFREPKIVAPVSGSSRGVVSRAETTITLPCQIEPQVFEDLQMLSTGRSPNSTLALCFHFKDLEDLGLIEAATGRPKIHINDRLDSIRDFKTGALIEKIPNPPGFFATQIQSRSFGLTALKRNLLLVTFEERELSTAGTA